MDDDVAELALLRRRAYGPDADISADPVAVARLEELETRVRLRFTARSGAVAIEPEPPAEGALGAATAPSAVISTTAPSAAAKRPPRHGRRIALVAGVAGVVAVAVLLGMPDAEGPTTAPPEVPARSAADARPAGIGASDSSETRLVDIPLDRSLARYVEQPAPPVFPIDGGLSWAESLGQYYGWTLWLARSAGGEQRCILLERVDKTYARCLPDEGFLAGSLEVSVPYGDVAADYRPARMTGGQSVVFRWTAERGVSIVLDEADITYFGDND